MSITVPHYKSYITTPSLLLLFPLLFCRARHNSVVRGMLLRGSALIRMGILNRSSHTNPAGKRMTRRGGRADWFPGKFNPLHRWQFPRICIGVPSGEPGEFPAPMIRLGYLRLVPISARVPGGWAGMGSAASLPNVVGVPSHPGAAHVDAFHNICGCPWWIDDSVEQWRRLPHHDGSISSSDRSWVICHSEEVASVRGTGCRVFCKVGSDLCCQGIPG